MLYIPLEHAITPVLIKREYPLKCEYCFLFNTPEGCNEELDCMKTLKDKKNVIYKIIKINDYKQGELL